MRACCPSARPSARPSVRPPFRPAALLLAAVLALAPPAAVGRPALAQEEKEKPKATLPPGVTAPQPSVPEVFTLMGQFVRVAHNNEGYATLGYRVANDSVGTEWMLLDVGVTVREPVERYVMPREALSLKTPDGTLVSLATQKEFAEAGYLKALTKRAQMSGDAINYFPIQASHPCAFRFFADISNRGAMSYDRIELAPDRACAGRIYFKVPGGIKTGQHWLVIKFPNSQLEVPFRILTEEEEKVLRKQWKELKEAHEASYK